MTNILIANAALSGAILVVVVGKLAWAIATQHRDWLIDLGISRRNMVALRLDRDGGSQRETKAAII